MVVTKCTQTIGSRDRIIFHLIETSKDDIMVRKSYGRIKVRGKITRRSTDQINAVPTCNLFAVLIKFKSKRKGDCATHKAIVFAKLNSCKLIPSWSLGWVGRETSRITHLRSSCSACVRESTSKEERI